MCSHTSAVHGSAATELLVVLMLAAGMVVVLPVDADFCNRNLVSLPRNSSVCRRSSSSAHPSFSVFSSSESYARIRPRLLVTVAFLLVAPKSSFGDRLPSADGSIRIYNIFFSFFKNRELCRPDVVRELPSAVVDGCSVVVGVVVVVVGSTVLSTSSSSVVIVSSAIFVVGKSAAIAVVTAGLYVVSRRMFPGSVTVVVAAVFAVDVRRLLKIRDLCTTGSTVGGGDVFAVVLDLNREKLLLEVNGGVPPSPVPVATVVDLNRLYGGDVSAGATVDDLPAAAIALAGMVSVTFLTGRTYLLLTYRFKRNFFSPFPVSGVVLLSAAAATVTAAVVSVVRGGTGLRGGPILGCTAGPPNRPLSIDFCVVGCSSTAITFSAVVTAAPSAAGSTFLRSTKKFSMFFTRTRRLSVAASYTDVITSITVDVTAGLSVVQLAVTAGRLVPIVVPATATALSVACPVIVITVPGAVDDAGSPAAVAAVTVINDGLRSSDVTAGLTTLDPVVETSSSLTLVNRFSFGPSELLSSSLLVEIAAGRGPSSSVALVDVVVVLLCLSNETYLQKRTPHNTITPVRPQRHSRVLSYYYTIDRVPGFGSDRIWSLKSVPGIRVKQTDTRYGGSPKTKLLLVCVAPSSGCK